MGGRVNAEQSDGRIGDHVRLSTDEHGVATLHLDRPPVNALNFQVWRELHDAATELATDPSVRAVVVWGGPRVFAAGADIKALRAESYQSFSAVSAGLQEALRTLARLPQIVIAAITGYALGGGCELALSADFRFAADDAKLGQPEILLGVIPGAGGTQRLLRLVGMQRARELVYSGRMVDAREALQIGLVDRVCPPAQVYEQAVERARAYARGPFALRLAKQAIDQGAELDLESALRLETTLFTACFATQDRAIGMRSFIEEGPGKAEFTGQ
ncbi:MAG: enoyl-CoA hydratase/isomerase family protein [Actinobacteria bacterium]|nr:enoyl-CoA hydratase/isomerase family protein [Actinomycetota bacterium]